MASSSPRARDQPPEDDLDEILRGIVEDRNEPAPEPSQTQGNRLNAKSTDNSGALGIDEEIVITKKRIPAPKLDEGRLLSDPGIPRLQRISKERLRFKGKGHEYGDIARMLNMYQLWLDDLYPRAKFLDALALVEKTGHSKRMQMIRKNLIYDKSEQPEADNDVAMGDEAQQEEVSGEQEQQANRGLDDPEPVPGIRETVESADDHDPDEDELDALLADSAQAQTKAPAAAQVRVNTGDDDPFADEMEAMAGMDW